MVIDFRRHMNLLVGFFMVSFVIILLMGFAFFLSSNGLFNPQFKLYGVFQNGIGLRKGTAVLFNGVNVGTVGKIDLLPGNGFGDGSSKVVLAFEIDAEYGPFINDKSFAYVMRDKNLVSDRVINIESPEISEVLLENGDTILVNPSRDIEALISRVNKLTQNVGPVVAGVTEIIARVTDSTTTAGALLGSRELYERILNEFNIISGILADSRAFMRKAVKIEREMESILPEVLGDIDTTFTTITDIATELKTVVPRLEQLLREGRNILAKVEGIVDNGSEEVENAGELIDAISDMWLIKGKIEKQKKIPFPLLTNGLGP